MNLALLTSQQYRIEGITDERAFLRAIPLLLEPEDRLVFASYGVSDRVDVRDFLKRHQLPPDKFVTRENEYMVDEDYPESFAVLWPVDVKLLGELIDLLRDSTNAVDLCHHVAAYGPRGPLFIYHDAFSGDPFYISTHVPEAAVAAFCAAIGKHYVRQTEER